MHCYIIYFKRGNYYRAGLYKGNMVHLEGDIMKVIHPDRPLSNFKIIDTFHSCARKSHFMVKELAKNCQVCLQ